MDPDGPYSTFGAVLREERQADRVELMPPEPYELRLLRIDSKGDSEIDSEVDGILLGRLCVDDSITSASWEGSGSGSNVSSACSSLKTSGSEGCRDLLLGIGGEDDCRIVFRSAIFGSWFFSSARLAPGGVFSSDLYRVESSHGSMPDSRIT